MNPSSPRILHLNSLLTGGGTDDRSVRIAHALIAEGCTVWMAGPAGRQFSKVIEELGVPFHRTPAYGPFLIPFIFSVAKFIRDQRVQIVHARHGHNLWPAILAGRLSGRRPQIVLSRHLAKSPSSWLSRHFLLSQCDAIFAVSHFVAKVLREGAYDPKAENPELRRRPPIHGDLSKIHVVYGGFDMKRFQPADASAQRAHWGLLPGQYAFAVAGTYDFPRGKGQPEFLRAAARVRARIPHARYLIVGRGDMKEFLEAEIERLGLKGLAWLTPYCHDMPAAMNAMDCLVLPQVGAEAMPGVVIEAHACGRPVIGSDLDGIPEAFATGGLGELVPPGHVEALGEALVRWACTPPLDLAGRRQVHARVAAQFSLERAASELAKHYRALLATPKDRT